MVDPALSPADPDAYRTLTDLVAQLSDIEDRLPAAPSVVLEGIRRALIPLGHIVGSLPDAARRDPVTRHPPEWDLGARLDEALRALRRIETLLQADPANPMRAQILEAVQAALGALEAVLPLPLD